MKYYLIEDNMQVGPFEVSELYNRGIRPDTLVWCETMENWTPAWKVAELHPVIDSSIVRRQPPKYEPEGPGTEEQKAEKSTADTANAADTTQHHAADLQTAPTARNHHPWLLASLIAAVIFGILVFTCPEKKAHEEVIRQEFNTAMSQKMGASNGIIEAGIQMVSKYFMGAAAESALDQLLKVDNYFLCSLGKIEYDGKERIASVGLLNHVFTVNNDDIVRVLDQAETAAREQKEAIENNQDSGIDMVKDIIDLISRFF
ncbi:MAG: DUF4339 domain-containing protein [Prevotella sp.]|nr:DUF4339 domain-containing protein [Prevotella sp.]